jgi:addiction module RelE/StbE family toxin
MPELILSDSYRKKSVRFLQEHPQLIKKYKKTLLLLQSNPFHPSLRLHALKGNLHPFRSISIDLKYRILIDFIIQADRIILIDIGDHQEIYGE